MNAKNRPSNKAMVSPAGSQAASAEEMKESKNRRKVATTQFMVAVGVS